MDGHLLPFPLCRPRAPVINQINRSRHFPWMRHACACLGMQFSSVQYCTTATTATLGLPALRPLFQSFSSVLGRRTASRRIWRRPECILPIIRLLNSTPPLVNTLSAEQEVRPCICTREKNQRSEQLSVRPLFSDCIQPNLPVSMQLSCTLGYPLDEMARQLCYTMPSCSELFRWGYHNHKHQEHAFMSGAYSTIITGSCFYDCFLIVCTSVMVKVTYKEQKACV
jgi:hypothetical protein